MPINYIYAYSKGIQNQNGVHKINLDLNGFKPQNVNVNLNGRLLTIKAHMDHSSEDGSQRIKQEISRQYTLPDNLELDKLRSLFSEDGMLSIEAPLKNDPGKEGGPKEIPISRSET